MVDLFEKEFIFVPIHDALHWSLAIVCNPGSDGRPGQLHSPLILHLDSLEGERPHHTVSLWVKLSRSKSPCGLTLYASFFGANNSKSGHGEGGKHA